MRELEAIILQNKNTSEETNANLGALIAQTRKLESKAELTAIAKANIDTKKSVNDGVKTIVDSINDNINGVKNVLSKINSKEIRTYEKELEGLSVAIKSLKDSIDGKDMVVNVPLDELTKNIKDVESAIKNIKEVKIPEFKLPSEFPISKSQVNELLLTIKSIPTLSEEFFNEKIDKFRLELSDTIKRNSSKDNSAGILAKNTEILDFFEGAFENKFKDLIKAIKEIRISVGGGGGLLAEDYYSGVDQIEETLQSIADKKDYVSSNIDTADATYYYFLSFIPGTTKWRINRLNKATYISDYATGDGSIATAWTDRASQTYETIY